MIQTRLTAMFGLHYPIISAPMGLSSGGQLAAAVSHAGGLGTFGATTASYLVEPSYVENQVRLIRSQTQRPFGVGFITPLIEECYQPSLELVLDMQVPAVLLSFGDPRPWLGRIKASGAKTICQVQTLDAARIAVAEGADVLAVQGNEAGGHTGKLNLLPFLAQALDAFPDTPVIAAGGMASARSLAAVLSAGADGAWMGTAFTAVREATEISDGTKQRILESDGTNTVWSEAIDLLNTQAYEAKPWPTDIAPRIRNNRITQAWHGKETQLREQIDEIAKEYKSRRDAGDPDFAPDYFGESAGFVSEIVPAREFMKRLCADAERHLVDGASRVSKH